MKGFYCLTWRITDAIKPKLWYMSRAPWDDKNEFSSSEKLYQAFADQQYGKVGATIVTPIIDQNEPFASDFSECRWTPPFSLARVEQGGYLFNLFSFNNIPAVNYAVKYNVQNAPGPDGKQCMGYISSGSWLAFDNISFDPSSTTFSFNVSAVSSVGKIELRLDEPEGQRIGEGIVSSTGGWQNWKDLTIQIKPTSGTHRLYLLFSEKYPGPAAQIQLDKANSQLTIIDSAIKITGVPGQKYRLELLKSRIGAERDHILLNMYAGNRHHDISEMTAGWVSNFNSRVTDISSLGNVVSVQNRFIQKNYLDLAWKQLNTYNTLAPENIEARGTLTGNLISWTCSDSLFRGFDIYRDGKKINPAPLAVAARSFEDMTSGLHTYQVYVLFWGNDSSNESVKVTAVGGDADKTPPQIVVISPPTSVLAGQPIWIKARLLDNRTNDLLSATLYYRIAGKKDWTALPMTRKIKATFVATIPANQISEYGIEYYISASDGTNESVFPAEAPSKSLSCIQEKSEKPLNLSSPLLKTEKLRLIWQPVNDAYYYSVYRSQQKDFKTGPENFLTYIAGDATLYFFDNGKDFKGEQMRGDWYYKITVVDKKGYESKESNVVSIPIP